MRISDWSSDVCSSDLLTSSATGSHGQLQLNANGSYTYTLTSPVDGPTANDGPLTLAGAAVFTYQAVDGSGNIANGTITIDVVDDVPTAADDACLTVPEEGTAIGGTVLTKHTPLPAGATPYPRHPPRPHPPP